METVTDFIFWGSKSLQLWDENTFAPWKESSDKHRWHTKKQRHHFADKGLPGESSGFSSNYVQMWELDHKEGWVPKNWRFWTVVLEKTLESPLDCKETKPVNPKGKQPWIFIGWTDVEAPILWPPDAKSWIIGKKLMLVKIEDKRRREEQRMKWLDCITNSMDMNLSKFCQIVEDRGTWHPLVHGVVESWQDLATEQ